MTFSAHLNFSFLILQINSTSYNSRRRVHVRLFTIVGNIGAQKMDPKALPHSHCLIVVSFVYNVYFQILNIKDFVINIILEIIEIVIAQWFMLENCHVMICI